MIRSREELAWAAGLFEGEGCFAGSYSFKTMNGKEYRSNPEARLTMTDKETVQRFRETLGFGKIYYVKPGKVNWKSAYKFAVGSFEHVQALGAMFWPWLSTRRREEFKMAMKAFEGKRSTTKRAKQDRLADEIGSE